MNMMSKLLLTFWLINCSCNNIIKESLRKDDLRAYKVKQTFPQFNERGKLMAYSEMIVKVFYYQDMKLYQLSYRFDSITESKTRYSEDREHFFIYREGETHGIDYDKYKSPFGKKISCDSLFMNEWIVVNNIYGIFLMSTPIEMPGFKKVKSNNIEVAYSFRDKYDSTKILAACYLKFDDKLKNNNVSLSRQLDSAFNSKLCNATFKYYKTLWEGKGVNSDEYESNCSLEEIQVDNLKVVMSLFSRFKGDHKVMF